LFAPPPPPPMHPQQMYMPQQSMINNNTCNWLGSTNFVLPQIMNTQNNDNWVDNGPRDHHFKTMCLRHINKHINLTCWHFRSSYKSCSQSHNMVMTLDPWVNPNINIDIGEP
jgi:hypothetical protein